MLDVFHTWVSPVSFLAQRAEVSASVSHRGRSFRRAQVPHKPSCSLGLDRAGQQAAKVMIVDVRSAIEFGRIRGTLIEIMCRETGPSVASEHVAGSQPRRTTTASSCADASTPRGSIPLPGARRRVRMRQPLPHVASLRSAMEDRTPPSSRGDDRTVSRTRRQS